MSLNRAAGTSYDQGFKDTSTGASALPQKVILFTPIATGKQSGFTDYAKPHTITSLKDFNTLFGVCPGYFVTRILKPVNGGGIGTVPLIVYPIEDKAGASAAVGDITPTVSTAATSNNTHTILFNGRDNIDGRKASYSVVVGDTVATIVAKQIAAINGMLYAPVVASDGTTKTTLTSTWKGVLSNKITVTIDTNGDACGVSYAIVNPKDAVGDPDITGALANIGDTWGTLFVNLWGSTTFAEIDAFVGIPNVTTGGTGRWSNMVMKPFVCVSGSTTSTIATLKGLMSSNKTSVCHSVFPCPNSDGYEFEAAANIVALAAPLWDKEPHKDPHKMVLPDMPLPTSGVIGDMSSYATRDELVAAGCSTVSYNDGYVVEDFIVFRRPDDQNPLAIDFSYVRDIMVDMNVAYNYKYRENRDLVGKTIVGDNDAVKVTGVIKPKDWKAQVFDLANDLAEKAMITDTAYTKANSTVGISGTDPQRINTVFYYKRTGIARKSGTTAYAGFNFGEA